ncbi:ABC transporter substrate-binding protein [Devosia sediminis]|uniref:ABC transporter substrate-binding protein n=1 Tax=Devosia sediminis TaxID=2798801 RepID=A0A934MJX8_9HYPH|nr:ABC transporter substrate-binding protein [Devosia sediminis]MBJ3784518.1 ABC transporter substrate-binding protein [Devosia sediminis]
MPKITSTVASMLLFAMLLSGPALAQSDEPFRLVVTHLEPPLVPSSVMDLALTLGYFEREGVDVELVRVQQTPSALAALQSGDGDMANIGVDALLQAIAVGADDLRAVTSPNKSLPFLIAAKDSVAAPSDLEGAVFAIGRIGSVDHSLSAEVFDTLGVDIDSMQLFSVGQPNVRAQALAAGQVDATTMSIGTWVSLPDRAGLHVLIDQDAYYAAAPVVSKVNAVPASVLAERPEDVEAVIRALIRISRDFAADPQLWVDAMAEALPHVDRQTLETLAPSYAGSWSINGGMSAAELRETTDWLYRTADFAGMTAPSLDAWVDFGPLDAVLAEVGIVDGADPADR